MRLPRNRPLLLTLKAKLLLTIRQKKKLLLARSLCVPAHVYVWDEPLNYIDVLSRVQLEGLLTEFQPAMLLVEHDAVFLQRVCTRVITMGGDA